MNIYKYFVYTDGDRDWKLNGNLHRRDGPAVIMSGYSEEWFLNGLRHREDGPAYRDSEGNEEWYREHRLHRDDGPALIYALGAEWWTDGFRDYDKERNEKNNYA
jgi:hypothetical protein